MGNFPNNRAQVSDPQSSREAIIERIDLFVLNESEGTSGE